MDGIDGINAGMDHVGISLSNGTKTSSENIQLNGRGTCLSYDPQTARLCCTWLCGHRSWRHIWLKISSTVSHSVRKRIVSQGWRRKSEGGTESCGDFCIMRGPSDWRGQWDWNRPILPFTGSPGPSPSLSRTHAFGPLHDSLVLSLLLSIYIYMPLIWPKFIYENSAQSCSDHQSKSSHVDSERESNALTSFPKMDFAIFFLRMSKLELCWLTPKRDTFFTPPHGPPPKSGQGLRVEVCC